MSKGNFFVPSLPTLWPAMLLGLVGNTGSYYPFSAANVRYFYFARNAIYLAVWLLGLEGLEVLVPAYHHGVEIEALQMAGAIPVFYRVGARMDVDMSDVERRITPRTGALYLTHYAGFPGPAAEMRALADKNGLRFIEDCALSLLSADGERPLGITGDASIFCLYKTLPVPNGGALVLRELPGKRLPPAVTPPCTSTVSHVLSSILQNLEMRGGYAGRLLRAAARGLGRHTVAAAGIERVTTGSDHFDPQQAGLGISPLSKRLMKSQHLARVVEARRSNYEYLQAELGDISTPLVDSLSPGVCPLFYPLVVDDKDAVLSRLAERGVNAIDLWRHFHPACDPAEFPEVAWLRRNIIELPCHQDINPRRAAHIVGAVRYAISSVRHRPQPSVIAMSSEQAI